MTYDIPSVGASTGQPRRTAAALSWYREDFDLMNSSSGTKFDEDAPPGSMGNEMRLGRNIYTLPYYLQGYDCPPDLSATMILLYHSTLLGSSEALKGLYHAGYGPFILTARKVDACSWRQ